MKAKPFIKWVGGKGQLIEQREALLFYFIGTQYFFNPYVTSEK